MTVKAFLEALSNNVMVVIRESDKAQVAEFNRDSYKAIAESYLVREIDDIEIVVKGVASVVITLKEVAEPPASITTDSPAESGKEV